MRSALICGCVAMLAAGVLGCGSSGSDTSTSSSGGVTVTAPGGATFTRPAPSSPSPVPAPTATLPANASFAARADAVCARYRSQRRSLFGQLGGQFRQSRGTGNLAQKASDVYRQLAASGRRQLDELRGLPAPPSKAAAIHDYFSSTETFLSDLDKLAAALSSSPRGALRSTGPKLQADGLKAHQLATGLGLHVCGGFS
jgi:hypothetical protein